MSRRLASPAAVFRELLNFYSFSTRTGCGRGVRSYLLPLRAQEIEHTVGFLGRGYFVGAMPPAAAQGLEKRSCIGKARGLGLRHRQPCLQSGLLSTQQLQPADLAR